MNWRESFVRLLAGLAALALGAGVIAPFMISPFLLGLAFGAACLALSVALATILFLVLDKIVGRQP